MQEDVSSEYLQSQDTVLRAVLDSLFDGVYIVDRDRRILLWNRGAEEITGYPASEVAGRPCHDNILNHIDENGRLLCFGDCPIEKTLETGEHVRAKVYPLNKSGRRFPVQTHISPLRDANGNIVAAIEVFRDISNEEEFRILQEKFNSVVKRYVSKTTYEEMAEQARSGAASNVRTRDLTVLYLDVVGFTAISEKNTPQEVVKLLNNVFGMCDVITREHHGDIDKFIGDCIMAVFIDANDAAAAAIRLQRDALIHFNQIRADEGRDPVRVRIGINSGCVVQGDVGTTDRKDLTVIGDVVNAAKRIESICPPGSVLVSDSTRARLSPLLAARFVHRADVPVKGREQPVRVFELSN